MLAVFLSLLTLIGGGFAVPAEAMAPDTSPSRTRFVRPIDGTVARPFAPGAHRYAAGHRGVDVAAPAGAVVRSSGTGTVAFAGMVAGRPVVSVEHAGGLRTTYEPVAAKVSAGQWVAVGEVIGTLLPGHSGCPAAACLHWGLRRHTPTGEVYLDPLLSLGHGAVRLKPLRPGDRQSS